MNIKSKLYRKHTGLNLICATAQRLTVTHLTVG